MKTTNLFIDFLIIGFIGVLPLFPFYHAISGKLEITRDELSKLTSMILPIVTASVYLIGMLYNQLSGYFVKMLGVVRGVPSPKKLQESIFSKSNLDYYQALQTIISKSPEAYAYLSYRRSIVRIFRSMILSMSVFIVSTVIALLLPDSISSVEGGVMIILSTLILVFSHIVFAKNLKGYYLSIVNFYKVVCDE